MSKVRIEHHVRDGDRERATTVVVKADEDAEEVAMRILREANEFDSILLERIMANLNEVMAKLDARDQQIADEHAQAAQVLANLRQAVTDLQAQIDAGANPTQLQTIADRLDAQGTAISAIIPDEPVPPPTEPPVEPTPQ